MLRTFTIYDVARQRPVADKKVVFVRRGEEFKTRTDGRGRGSVEFPHDWVDKVELDYQVIARDIDLSGGWGKPKTDIGTIEVGAESLRTLRVCDPEGRPMGGAEIIFVGGGHHYKAKADRDGHVRIAFPHDYIDQLVVNREVIKEGVNLAGGWGGPTTDLGTLKLRRTGLDGQVRRLRLIFEDREPVSERDVVFWKGEDDSERRGDQGVRTKTDRDGRLAIPWPHEWVGRVEVDQVPVKRNWYVGNTPDLDELTIPRPGEDNPEDPNYRVDKETEQGVRGYLFFQDGTRAFGGYEVKVQFIDPAHGDPTFTTEQKPGYCKDDGEFFIATPRFHKHSAVRFYINTQEVPRSQFFHTPDELFVVLIPEGFGRKHGDKGGLITGTVVDKHGDPMQKVKVTGTTRGMFGGREAVTHTDKYGRFILPFEGGIELKRFYVEGNPPARITKGKGPNEREISAEDLRAGMFGLRVYGTRKMFGFF